MSTLRAECGLEKIMRPWVAASVTLVEEGHRCRDCCEKRVRRPDKAECAGELQAFLL